MAKTVREIMNPELFSIRPDEPIESARISIMGLGVTAAPVVDEQGRTLGMLSLRDVVDDDPGRTAQERMTEPAVVVAAETTVEKAADLLAQQDLHHVAVVDQDGVAVGFLSTLDVIRGLRGLPIRHPLAFPHLDAQTGVSWTNDLEPQLDVLRSAPDGPGVWILIQEGAGARRTIVWAEASANVCSRLIDLVSLPQSEPSLAQLLAQDTIRVRAASVSDPEQRARVLELVRPHPSTMHPPGAK
jgi:CBS domain-containing protein